MRRLIHENVPGREVAEVDAALEAALDADGGARDLASDERWSTAGGLVVEENPVRREHTVRLTVVDADPERVLSGTTKSNHHYNYTKINEVFSHIRHEK